MNAPWWRNSEIGHLLRLAAPVSAALVANMMMQVVDTMFVGRVGAEAIGGVSIGNAVFATLMIVGIGLMLGLDYLISHAWGAGEVEECNRFLIQALYVATGVSALFTPIMYFATDVFAAFGVEPGVASEAGRYLRTLCFSLWPFLLFSAFRQYLQAMGVATPVLVILIAANGVNALANWVFVFGNLGSPAFGVAGSGLATCVARTFMVLAAAAYVFRRDRKLDLGLRRTDLSISPERVRRLVRLGLPAGMQLLFEVGAFATATMLAGRLGAVPLAAHQIVLHIASLTFMVPLGLSISSAVRVGNALGAGQRHRAARIGWTAIAMAAAFMLCMGITMYAASSALLGLFTLDRSVLVVGTGLLLVAALFQLSDGVQVVGAGVLRGLGNTRSSMVANLAGHWMLGLPVGYALCFRVGLGAYGLWIGLSLGLTAVAVSLVGVWWRAVKAISA